jgi:hypothetical protein
MKNMSVLLVFILTLVAGTIRAHALLVQGPNVLYSPHPFVISKPTDISPQGPATVRVGQNVHYQEIVRSQKDVEDLAPVGATIFVQSCPVEYLKG